MIQKHSIDSRKAKRYLLSIILIVILILSIFLNLLTGADGLQLEDTRKILQEKSNFDLIITQIRLPRVMAALLAGALLGLSGAIMQGSLKNPLASPFTLGISQAAAFGASFAIIVLQVYADGSTINSNLGVGLCAFLASIFCMSIILFTW